MEQMFELLESIETDDSDEADPIKYRNDPIKYVPERIKAEGYPSEVHEVVTDDGYILELHRVPYGKKSPQTDKHRPPVLLMHPFLESSNGWIVLGPDHSIAYLLADAGYDVWMGNARGTELILNNELASAVAKIACGKATNQTPFDCKLLLTIFGSNQINCTTLDSIAVATPAGASTRQALHYTQFVRSKGFNQFDYDSKILNRKMYGSDTPPAYDFTKVTTPINLYYSKDDNIVAAENIIELQSQLKSLKSTYVIPIDDFAHVDFIYSRYLREVVNTKLLSNINRINKINKINGEL